MEKQPFHNNKKNSAGVAGQPVRVVTQRVGASLTEALFIILFLFFLILICGCTVTATKTDETMYLKGFGAKSATWPGGYSITKQEPIRIPDITPEVTK